LLAPHDVPGPAADTPPSSHVQRESQHLELDLALLLLTHRLKSLVLVLTGQGSPLLAALLLGGAHDVPLGRLPATLASTPIVRAPA
jgi:hypothetical protein